MFKVKLSVRAQKSKIHITQILLAAQKIVLPEKPKLYKDRYKTVNIDGTDLWLTYEWRIEQDNMILFVKEVKYPKKKRKR